MIIFIKAKQFQQPTLASKSANLKISFLDLCLENFQKLI